MKIIDRDGKEMSGQEVCDRLLKEGLIGPQKLTMDIWGDDVARDEIEVDADDDFEQIARDYVADGDWGEGAISISYEWEVCDESGDQIDSGSDTYTAPISNDDLQRFLDIILERQNEDYNSNGAPYDLWYNIDERIEFSINKNSIPMRSHCFKFYSFDGGAVHPNDAENDTFDFDEHDEGNWFEKNEDFMHISQVEEDEVQEYLKDGWVRGNCYYYSLGEEEKEIITEQIKEDYINASE